MSVLDTMKNFGSTTLVKFQKVSPQVMTVAGGVAVVAGVVLACRATLKIDDILDRHSETIKKIQEGKALANGDTIVYSEEDYKKDLAITYTRTAVDLVKRYAPAALTVFAGIGLMAGGNYILGNRLAAVTAAYTVCKDEFDSYRDRVKKQFGEAVERDIRDNLRIDEVTETVTDENGEEKEVSTSIEHRDDSYYVRFFDKSSTHWSNSTYENACFLKCKWNECQYLLHSRGYLFLREVFEMLDIQKLDDSDNHKRKSNPDISSIVGWVTTKDGSTMNMVDFGIENFDEIAKIVPNGEGIRLEFNVDGVIYDRI